MESAKSSPILDQLIEPLGERLTLESARKLLALKADTTLQSHINDLAERHNQGLLTPDERVDYVK
jgi:hypothetical protein